MNLASFISRRLTFNREKSFSRLISRIGLLAVALCICVMILADAMASGFKKEISTKLFGMLGHLQLTKTELSSALETPPMPSQIPFLQDLEKDERVESTYPFIEKYCLLKTRKGEGSFDGIRLLGIGKGFNWNFFSDALQKGRLPKEGSAEILISQTTAKRLSLDSGDRCFAYFIEQEIERVQIKPLRVSGIYSTGLEEYDKEMAIVGLAFLQNVNEWDGDTAMVAGYKIMAKAGENLDSLALEFYAAVPMGYDVFSLPQLKPNIFDWLSLHKEHEFWVLLIMMIVAVINMITVLLILILERTNMIGRLKAMGAKNRLIQNVFLRMGSRIIIFGLLLGNVLGIGLCLLQKKFGFIRLDEAAYYVQTAPIVFDWSWLVIINLIAFLVCMLCLIVPSMIVSRISPLKTIQFR